MHIKNSQHHWLHYIKYDILALSAGVSLTLAFAPYNHAIMAILAPLGLIFCWQVASRTQIIWRGWLFGIGFFATSTSWIYISIHDYGGAHAIISLSLTVLFIAFMALFPALAGYISHYLFRKRRFAYWLIGIPSCWVFTEWLRSKFLSGFPWVLLGYSQVDGLAAYLPLLGTYGVAFLLMFLSGLCYIVWREHWQYKMSAIAGIAMIILINFMLPTQWVTPSQQQLNVSLIQGNINQLVKWDEHIFSHILDHYAQSTTQEFGQDIIILPESAIPAPSWAVSDYLATLGKEAKKHNSAVVVGVPVEAEKKNNDQHYFNAMLVYGNAVGQYYKRHLVPFGEFLPLRSVLQGLIHFFNVPMSDFIPGDNKQSLISINNILIAPLICYEIAYSNLVFSMIPQAQLILLINDDSWFGHSNAAQQHIQIAQTRALETGRYILFESNTGITAIINPQGKIVQQAPIDQPYVLRGHVVAVDGSTPLMRYGQTSVLLVITCLFLFSLCWCHIIRRR